MTALRRIAFLCALIFSVAVAHSQVATGTYPYGTFDNKGFDTINVGSLNVHFSIPVLNKAGRGLPFYYNLSYDNSVWYPATVSGSKTWTPVSNFGWRGDTEIATGYLSRQEVVVTTGSGSGHNQTCTYDEYLGWVYHDSFGVSHSFPSAGWTWSSNPSLCGTPLNNPSGNHAIDGSGYTLNIGSATGGTLVSANGKQVSVPALTYGAATATDTNGNQVSANGSGQFTDTTGKVVLTVAGNAPSAHTFTYTDTSGNPQSVSMNYTTYTVQTNFGCSGIGEYGPTSTSLVSSIALPGGSGTYQFTYEQTPGVSGSVTGRLASITLPTGGVISYTYTGGGNGADCVDGSTATLTRTVSANGGSAASTWSYSRPASATTTTSQTVVTDGLNNTSTYSFVLGSVPSGQTNGITADWYETNRVVNQGSSTPLLSRATCYNAAAQPCTTTALTLPITQIDTYETSNGIQEHGSTAKYNASGLQTEEDDYAYGGSSARGALLRKEVWTYPSTGIASLLSEDQVYDGSGNLAGQTTYTYDGSTPVASSGVPQHVAVSGQRGNLTGTVQYASAGSSITTSATFEDTGSILTSTTPNGTTNYSYDSTFVYSSGLTPPTSSSGMPLPYGLGYDTSYTGLITSSTDPNSAQTGTQTGYKYNDPLLRPTEVDNPDGGKTMIYYRNTTTIGIESYQNASTYADTETMSDDYGRASRTAVANGQSTNPWYQQDTCYDANGNVAFRSYSYEGAGWTTAKVCSGSGDTYSYDALGRLTEIAHADGTSVNYIFRGRATKVVDENGVTRISQVDGLGRITTACEVSSSTLQSMAPVSCGTDIAGTGFLTGYAYNLLTPTTTVTQGSQTRTFQTDWLGRPTMVQEPERGTTNYTYSYNATGLLVTRTRPKANQTNPSVLTTTTVQYDSLGRPNQYLYNDNLTPTKLFYFDTSANWIPTQSNIKGRLSEIVAGVPPNASGTIYSYDAMGRPTQVYTCLPSGCGAPDTQKALTATFDWTGNLTAESDPVTGSISYGRSLAGEVTSITNNTYQGTGNPADLISNVTNGPDGPITYTFGNGRYGYDSYNALGQQNGAWVCSTPSTQACPAAPYGYYFTGHGSQVAVGYDNVTGQGTQYTYDEFNRLKSTSFSTGQTFNYVYDRYGNRWQQNAPQGGSSFSVSYNPANNQLVGYSYDAAGNMTNDGVHSYTYDAEGNILQVDGGATAQYTYDVLNRMVRAQTGSSTLEYLYDYAGRLTSSWLPSASTGSEGRIYWDGRQIGFRASNGQTYFDHKDWVGTERMRTDYTGAIAAIYYSLPWGDGYSADISETPGDSDSSHFAGLDQDDNTANAPMSEHAQFRQYSPAQGRWFSPDPYDGSYDFTNPQSLNRYSYVLNNPLSFIDPLGLDCYTVGGDTWSINAGGTITSGSDSGGTLCTDGGDGAGNDLTNLPPPNCTGLYNGARCITPQQIISIVAPNSFVQLLKCASKYGQAHSLGAALGGGAIANFLGGNSVSSLLNLGLAISGQQPLSGSGYLTGGGLGLPINDVLRLTGNSVTSSLSGQSATALLGSPAGFIRSTAIQSAANALIGTGNSIVSLSGEASLASFGGVATTAATAAEAASVVGIAKFGYDALSVIYGGVFACSQ